MYVRLPRFYFILSLSSPAAQVHSHNRRTRRFRIAVCQQHVVLQRLHLRHGFIQGGWKIRGQRYIFRTNQLYVFRSQVIFVLRSKSSYRLRLFDLPTAGCVRGGKTIKLTVAIRFSQGKYLNLVSGQAYWIRTAKGKYRITSVVKDLYITLLQK
jgi:hypothetical protein